MDGEGSALRLFLGLWPPRDLVPQLVAHADQWSWTPAARRTRPERMHITVHFLGNVPATMLPALLRDLRVDWPGDTLLLDQGTVWHGGIAVLEATKVPSALAKLHAQLAERLRALELPVESRPYRPHVTLARKGFGARPPDFAPLRWQAGPGYALVRSLGGGRGYETLQAFG
jgi:2'-5' RNA ligase